MARAILGAAMLVGLLSHSTLTARADSAEDITREAQRAGVDPVDLEGALSSEHEAGNNVTPCEYEFFNGEVEGCIGTALMIAKPPEPPSVSVSLAARVACIEAKESGGANVWNRSGSGAGGVMQFMAPTFRAHAAEMGHPEYSLWNPAQARAVAAHDLALGRRAQWTVGGCP